MSKCNTKKPAATAKKAVAKKPTAKATVKKATPNKTAKVAAKKAR